jgi:preprotein translocase subunit SecE
MNRQMKRAQERAERLQKSGGSGVGGGKTAPPGAGGAAAGSGRARPPAGQQKRKRTGARQFLREVRLELKKVDWPTRKELVTYTIVVLVTITVLTSFVFGVDYVFSKLVFSLLD